MAKPRKYLSLDGEEFMAREFEIERFVNLVEEEASENNSTYLEALMIVIERENIDPETAGILISPVMKEKLELEAESLNLIKKTQKKNSLYD